MEIIFGVDAGLVHPLLLPASQGPERFGYIVIAYEDLPEEFDILFVRGNRIEQYAGINHDLRLLLNEQSVRVNLEACALRCRVYFYSVTRKAYDRFLRTFHCTPSVNVAINRLSRKQVVNLLRATGCTNGILEVDRLFHPLPAIDLIRFHSAEQLLGAALRFRQGRMMVYDLALDARIRQRVGDVGGDSPASAPEVEEDPAGTNGDEVPEPPVRDIRDSPGANAADDEMIGAFMEAFSMFMNEVGNLNGGKVKEQAPRVVSHFFPPAGAIGHDEFTPAKASLILGVIEEYVKEAKLGKRNDMREKALEVVKNLFETHTELLRKYGFLEKVQECYQRLEK